MAASPPAAPGRIFISYRREETAYPASWLFHRLTDHFRGGEVFKDVDSIQLGDDFVEVITRAVGSCDVLLALIGEQWLTITDEDGRRRIDNTEDFVRVEIEAALTRNVRVIPILVDGARMPRADDLPESLAKLVRRQALELSPDRFDFDTSKLLKVLDETLAEVRTEHFEAIAGRQPQAPPPPDGPRVPAAPTGREEAPRRLPPASPPVRPPGGEEQRRRRSNLARILVGAGAAVALVVVLATLLARPGPPVTVPDPAGGSVADATALLQREGLKVGERREASETVGTGKLIRTEPPANTQLEQGDRVTLVVSSGPKVTPLPDGTDKLVVGYTARFASTKDNPDTLLDGFDPILFADPGTGKLQGLDVDLANALGKKLGVTVSFQDAGHHTHMFGVVRDQKVDISMSVLRDGPKPNPHVDFADYLRPNSALLIPAGNPQGIRSLDDLCGRTVARPIEMPHGRLIDQGHRCVATGKPAIMFMSCPRLSTPPRPNSGDGVPLKDCPPGADPLQLVIDGQVHAAVMDLPVAENLVDTPTIGQRLMIAPTAVESAPYAIAVRKGDRVVREAVRSAMRALIADGTYARLLAKWDLKDYAVKAADVNGAS